jgi:NADH-quinone oxidoreductase subunit E
MAEREMKNAPDAAAWVMAAGAGLVALGATIVIGKFDLTPAAFIACLVALVVGVVLTIGWSERPAAQAVAKAEAEDASAPASTAARVAQPLRTAPVTTPVADVADDRGEKVAAKGDGPERLTAPRNGKADNLKEIEGIGPALEKLCNELGFWHFDQIASWSDADVAWVDANMRNFKGRIVRDKWVAQARLIVGEGLEAFRVRAKTNDY